MLVPMEYGIRPTRDGPRAVHVCTRCLSSTNAAQINFKPFPPFTKSTGRASGAPGPDCNAASESFAPASTINVVAGLGPHGMRRFARFIERRLRDDRDGLREVAMIRRLDRAARRHRRSRPRRRFRSGARRLVTKSAAVTRSGMPVCGALRERAYLTHVHAERGQRAECLTRLFKRLARVVNVCKSPIEIQLQITLGHRQRRPDFVGQRIQDLRQVRLHLGKRSTFARPQLFGMHREMAARQMGVWP